MARWIGSLFGRRAVPDESRAPLGTPTIVGANGGLVSVEWLVIQIRYHPNGGGKGAPYTFSCNVTRMGDVGYISMATQNVTGGRRFTPEVYREIERALRGLGIKRVDYERRNLPGEPRHKSRT